MKTIVPMSASTAALALSVGGDVGGNGQVAVIEVESDGGQFHKEEVLHGIVDNYMKARVHPWSPVYLMTE